jgi:putative flippase GtrA
MILKQFVSFTAVGAVGTAAHYSALIALVQFMHVSPVPSSGVGFVIGALVNYALNYRLTFRSKKLHRESMPKFFLVAMVGLVLNTAVMVFLVEILRLHYLVSQVLATGGVLVWNFTANRYWTFK